jgi:hypothetical protein
LLNLLDFGEHFLFKLHTVAGVGEKWLQRRWLKHLRGDSTGDSVFVTAWSCQTAVPVPGITLVIIFSGLNDLRNR